MSNKSIIRLNTSSILRVVGLKNENGVYQNDATVELVSLRGRGWDNEVTGITYPLDIPYVVGSNGVYSVSIPSDIGVTLGRTYKAVVRATTPLGITKEWTEIVRVERAAS